MSKFPVTLIKKSTGEFVGLRIDGKDVPVTIAAPGDIANTMGLNIFAESVEAFARIGGVEVPLATLGRGPLNGKTVFVVGVPDVEVTFEVKD